MKKRLMILAGSISIATILSGCFEGEQSLDEIDPPQNAQEVDNLDKVNEEDVSATPEETAETVSRDLYLLDANGMVASQTLELPVPDTNEVAAQVLEHLVKGGPVTPLLPNGFQAVLPEGTEVLGVNLQEDGTIIVDLSEEFTQYEENQEVQILESVTHTLTQFENVHKVKLRVNGQDLKEMPVNGTPINSGYSRANGINIINNDTLDYLQSEPVTMYYPVEQENNRYYLPVTQYIETNEDEAITNIIKELIDGPGYQSKVVNVFNPEAGLASEPILNNGILEVVFNKEILADSEQGIIADEVMETMVRTLTEQPNIDAVDVKVENVEKVVNENGEAYTEPVTKQVFLPSEEL